MRGQLKRAGGELTRHFLRKQTVQCGTSLEICGYASGCRVDQWDPSIAGRMELAAEKMRSPTVFNLNRYVPALVVGATVIAAGPAYAAQTRSYSNQRDYLGFDRRAYDNGYREGLEQGADDVRHGRRFEYARDDDYRDADNGYSRSRGDKEAYRRIFREGYAAGYTEGYRGFRGPRYGAVRGPQGGWWPNRSYSPAPQVGYQDGYAEGRDDARDRDGYNPQRAKRYRDGDHEYDDRYGSRGQYRQEYRAAFLRGYERGFREFGRTWDR